MAYVYRKATPSPAALARIAAAFGVQPQDLIDVPDDVRLSDLRAYAGLSVSELAEKVHLTANYAGSVGRGEIPVAHPDLWAEALGVSEAEVLEAWTNSRRHLAQD